MCINVAARHRKTDKPDVLLVIFSEVLPPIKRDIAALDDEVLPVLDSCLDDFSHNGPKVIRESIIIQRCKTGVSTTDKAHLQVVDGEGRILVFLKYPLC